MTVTPYLIVQDAPAEVEFVRRVFSAAEGQRMVGGAGGLHTDVRIGDAALMIGGGAPGVTWKGASMPSALHIYVQDTDAAFARAVEAGAVPTHEPVDQEYGERSGGVRDAEGNHWFIATAKGPHFIPEGLRAVNAYLHPVSADPLIAFLEQAFGGVAVERHSSPDGVVHHARVRIGDSAIEMGEAHGPYQPMPTMFYVRVPDVDGSYRQALALGATSLEQPADQAYGDRRAGFQDPFGNQWFVAAAVSRES